MRELAGKTVFVTGGASGIGLALGRAIAGSRRYGSRLAHRRIAAASTTSVFGAHSARGHRAHLQRHPRYNFEAHCAGRDHCFRSAIKY
jgi:NAD(P)-dependent dehydrogenase (short-subunit alcohol dehydrogenase family)